MLLSIYPIVTSHGPNHRMISRLQRLKGQGLDLQRFGLDAESGLCEESVDEGGPVLDALEQVLHDGGQLAASCTNRGCLGCSSWSTRRPPAENQRGMKLVVRSGDQAGVVGFGHGPAPVFPPGVHSDPVENRLRIPGRKQVIPPRTSARSLSRTPRRRSAAAAGPGQAQHLDTGRPWAATLELSLASG